MGCNPISHPPGIMGFYPDKVFPEEVDNIKEYMRGSFTTNVNGFVDENGNPFSRMERESHGLINLQPLRNYEDDYRGMYLLFYLNLKRQF
jgi:hypothetical protein